MRDFIVSSDLKCIGGNIQVLVGEGERVMGFPLGTPEIEVISRGRRGLGQLAQVETRVSIARIVELTATPGYDSLQLYHEEKKLGLITF